MKKQEPASTQIQLRVTPSRKAAYVAAAVARGLALSEWIFDQCDAALIVLGNGRKTFKRVKNKNMKGK